MEGLISLLYPFEYTHVFIPVLHRKLYHFLQAPVPFLIGAHRDSCAKLLTDVDGTYTSDIEIPENVLVVDLDRDRLFTTPLMNNNSKIDQNMNISDADYDLIEQRIRKLADILPKRQRIKLVKNLCKYYCRVFQIPLEVTPSSTYQRVKLGSSVNSKINSSEESDEDMLYEDFISTTLDEEKRLQGGECCNCSKCHSVSALKQLQQQANGSSSSSSTGSDSPVAGSSDCCKLNENVWKSVKYDVPKLGSTPPPVSASSLSVPAAASASSSVSSNGSDSNPVAAPAPSRGRARSKIVISLEQFSDEDLEKTADHQLRRCFSKFFVSIFKKYRVYIAYESASTAANKKEHYNFYEIFDTKAFIQDAPIGHAVRIMFFIVTQQQLIKHINCILTLNFASHFQDFLTVMVDTQLFQYYIQTRLTNPTNILFEAKVKRRMERYALNLSILASKTKQSLMWKRGQIRKSWKHRYFDLKNCQVRYFTDSSMSAAAQKGSMLLTTNGTTKVSIPPANFDKFPTPYPFSVHSNERILICCADSDDVRREWIQIVKARCMDEKLRERIVTTFQASFAAPICSFENLVLKEEPYLMFTSNAASLITKATRTKKKSVISRQLPDLSNLLATNNNSGSGLSDEESDSEQSSNAGDNNKPAAKPSAEPAT